MNIYYDVEDNHYRTYPDGDIASIDQMRELIENKNLSIVKLQQENKKLKIQISAREEEYKKLENKLTETENWLRPAILQLMDFAKQDYYWITDQQIDNAKLVPIEFSVMGDGCVKFKKLERGVSDVED